MNVFYTLGGWLIVAVMAVRAVWLWFAWQGASALPMQWGLTGHPTWYASRGVALGLMPVMAVCIVALVQFAPREASAARVFTTALLFLVIQTGYLYLARRYV